MDKKTITTTIPNADYFFDPDGWETTYHRNDLESEAMIDVGENTPKRFTLLKKVGEMWLVEIDNGNEIRTEAFATKIEADAAAIEAVKQKREAENEE